MSGDTVTVLETGLCEVVYNLAYSGNASADASAVLSVNGKAVEVTRRKLENQAGVGAIYFFTVNSGDVLKVELTDTDGLQDINVNIIVKLYNFDEET